MSRYDATIAFIGSDALGPHADQREHTEHRHHHATIPDAHAEPLNLNVEP